jgi:hypothetical protein
MRTYAESMLGEDRIFCLRTLLNFHCLAYATHASAYAYAYATHTLHHFEYSVFARCSIFIVSESLFPIRSHGKYSPPETFLRFFEKQEGKHETQFLNLTVPPMSEHNCNQYKLLFFYFKLFLLNPEISPKSNTIFVTNEPVDKLVQA